MVDQSLKELIIIISSTTPPPPSPHPRDDQKILNEKLNAIQKKLIVGGVDLLAKSEEQEQLLEQSALEMKERMAKQESMRKMMEEREQERMDIEEKYSSLQDEAHGKTKKLKKVWTMLMQAKSEVRYNT